MNTRSCKTIAKLQIMILRDQIINEDFNFKLFKNTRLITYNETHEFYADELDQTCQQTKIFKVFHS